MAVVVLPEESVYRYWDQGTLVPGWLNSGFDDTMWPSGVAPLGFGDAYISTTIGFGPDSSSKYPSTWFRTTFDVANAAAVLSASIELKVDDGAVVYLNGNEWVRWNMPSGTITTSTLASQILEAGEEGFFIPFDVNPSLLVDGKNVLAIEVHQAVLNSSDLGIDARITLQVN
ncbi:MAG: beta galactosidase jelly roll domain-containing protein [Polyangiaceae bacterium]|nr:beta galactosidase jelly roll domain-containing protein [Polyangiaceae bacterium]